MAEGFRGAIVFLEKLGVYDVVLPFLLVFTIIFAILEKTRILGVEKVGGQDLTKKNLNSIVAFVVAFLVIASTTKCNCEAISLVMILFFNKAVKIQP